MKKRMLNRLAATLLMLSGVLAAQGAVAAEDTTATTPQVELRSGKLVGKLASADGVALHEFFGIPYAAAPVRNLRWKPPQPAGPWHGLRKATAFGPQCMQRAVFDDMVFRSSGMSEDCLHLNVWTPATPGNKRPVLVYFYGGGFIAGDGSEPRYDGASLAARGIVTVTVSYRLGVFGFLALPALADESPHHAAGNYGLLDQVAALRWVKANIARFGGDPARVTIGGESAGSISVSALMASGLSKHLIAGAMGESGALIAPIAPLPLADAQRHGQALQRKLGADSLDALRAMPAQKLLQAGSSRMADAMPDIDGYFLKQAPAEIFSRGQQAQVPLLLGSNSQEGDYPAILEKQPPTPANYRGALQRIFGDKAEQALALYPGSNDAGVKRSATALAGDLFIAHSTWEWMALNRETNARPTWFYYFDRARPTKREPRLDKKPESGAVHSAEIEYALGNLDGNRVFAWTAADRATSKAMEGYFANFIKTGNPNGEGLPSWPAAAKKNGGVLRQVIDATPHTRVDHGGARQAFLRAWFDDHGDRDMP